jgi:hypothetical protein
MNTQPTPETDKFFATFADGEATPSHAEYYARLQDLERERDEARAESIRWMSIAEGRGRTDDEEQLTTVTAQRDRLAEALHLIADGTSCRECGGEDQALFAREAIQSMICDALQSLTPKPISQ